jgi:DNA (cytosine-5)-methyltransferase 1
MGPILKAVAEQNPQMVLPKRQNHVPPPEPVSKLPNKYQKYIGEHADHPGTGKARRAQLLAAE